MENNYAKRAFRVYRKEIDALTAQREELLKVLERAEQTIRNLGNGFLTGDGEAIALNEASNIRAACRQYGKEATPDCRKG